MHFKKFSTTLKTWMKCCIKNWSVLWVIFSISKSICSTAVVLNKYLWCSTPIFLTFFWVTTMLLLLWHSRATGPVEGLKKKKIKSSKPPPLLFYISSCTELNSKINYYAFLFFTFCSEFFVLGRNLPCEAFHAGFFLFTSNFMNTNSLLG